MWLQRWLALSGLLLLVSCSASNRPAPSRVSGAPGEHIEVPGAVSSYSTEPAPEGVVGGPTADRLAAELSEELSKRGVAAASDGALAATASWILREMNEGRPFDQLAIEAAARRFGFAGVVESMAGFPLGPDSTEPWREALQSVPPNMPITRYGVSVASSGRSGALVLGAVEASLAPVARHFPVNGQVELRGEVAARYRSAHVYLTKADGSVDEKRLPSRKVQASFSLPTPGVYKLEVMGDGPSGPVIVFNVPLYVGVPEEERVTGSSGNVTSPAEGETRMFELLNQARAAAGIAVLRPDDELRSIAARHSEDMVTNHFFGHVSPTTGTTEDRARRSGIVVAAFGENVAQANSAERAFDLLMASPGHRANMMSPQFSHVGVAALENGDQQLVFTLNFGRRVDPAVMPRTAADVEAAFRALRAKKGLSQPASDRIYQAAAAAGAQAYAAASNPTPDVAMRAQNAALTREVQRARSSRPGGCSFLTDLLELRQLEQHAILQSPTIRRFGIGAQLRTDDHGSRLAVMMLLEGAPCQ